MIPDIVIPKSGFELVGEKLALVLTEELNSKLALIIANEGIDLTPPTVYFDLWSDLNVDELPAVTVAFADAKLLHQSPGSRRNRCRYFIDLFFQAKNNQDELAYRISHRQTKRVMGLIAYVLSSPQYKTLELDSVCATPSVTDFGIFTKDGVPDARSTAFGRIVYEVTINEVNNPSGVGYPLEISSTKFRQSQDDRGMYWEYNIQ